VPSSSNPFETVGYWVYLAYPSSDLCEFDFTTHRGVYTASDGFLVVCTGPSGGRFPDEFAPVAIHEYFHATQYGFPATYQGNPQRFLIEGTAEAAERSYVAGSSPPLAVSADPRPRRRVDIPPLLRIPAWPAPGRRGDRPR
jgi:hypothetical protein